MTKLREDGELRARFQQLREETEQPGRIPLFRAMLDRASDEAAASPALEVVQGGQPGSDRGVRPKRRIVRAGAWASAALAAALAGVLLTNAGPDPDAEFERLVTAYARDPSGGAWRSPTSGLLEFPGIELIRSIPSVGGSVRGLDPGRLPTVRAPEGRENR